MRASLDELHAYALSYRVLTPEALTDLEQAGFEDPDAACREMTAELAGAATEVGIVQKCNAVIVVVVAAERHNHDFIRRRVVDSWDRLARGTILPILPKLGGYRGLDALQFLLECAVGLHSLVTGDSQVLKQVTAIAPADGDSRRTVLGRLARAMREVAGDVRTQTRLNDGEISAERLACGRVVDHVPAGDGRIVVVGSGSSADLVTKILAQEEHRDVVVVNRTVATAQALAERRGARSEPLEAAPRLENVSAVVLAVPRTEETVGLAGRLVGSLANGDRGLLVVDLSARPLLDYDRLPVTSVTLAAIGAEARRQMAVRQESVSRAHEVIRSRLALVARDVDARDGQAHEPLRPLRPEKRQLIGQRARILHAVRGLLDERGFAEITTPCVVDVASDPPPGGDEEPFALDWLGSSRFLRQSTQLHKQMAVAAGAERVYEIGPFWRREAVLTPRHLYETTGLDAEWRLDDRLDELLALAYDVVAAVARAAGAGARLPAALATVAYDEAIAELQRNNVAIAYGDPLGSEATAELAAMAGGDVFAVTHFPDVLRRFYTQSLPGGLTATFDLVVLGWKVASGAVRETDRGVMERRLQLAGLPPSHYEFYLQAVEAAPPHGGFGLGLDRLVARLLGLQSVLDATLFAP